MKEFNEMVNVSSLFTINIYQYSMLKRKKLLSLTSHDGAFHKMSIKRTKNLSRQTPTG